MTRTLARIDRGREQASHDRLSPLAPPPTRLLFSDGAFSDVDAVWWPRTQNLSVELHALVHGLAGRVGPVSRIHFEWNAVSALQRHIDGDDGLDVRGLEPGQSSRVMRFYGRNGIRADIAVVEPGLDTDYGYRRMRRVLDGHRLPASG